MNRKIFCYIIIIQPSYNVIIILNFNARKKNKHPYHQICVVRFEFCNDRTSNIKSCLFYNLSQTRIIMTLYIYIYSFFISMKPIKPLWSIDSISKKT